MEEVERPVHSRETWRIGLYMVGELEKEESYVYCSGWWRRRRGLYTIERGGGGGGEAYMLY